MDSPFKEYINTNWIPSDKEIPSIKALINERKDVVDQMNEEIQQVEKTLTALKDRRGAQLKYIEDHESFLSPIKHLPIDLLSSIFLACVPTDDPYTPYTFSLTTSIMTKDHPSVVISHVCRQWRQVSLNTPLLWAKIKLSPPIHPEMSPVGQPYYTPPLNLADLYDKQVLKWERSTRSLKHILQTWISRSSGCPLSLHFSAQEAGQAQADGWLMALDSTPAESLATKELGEFVDILCSTSTRWKAVNFELSVYTQTSPLLRLLLVPPEDVPLLESYKFILLFNSMPPIGPDWESLKQSLIPDMGAFRAPLLRSLTLSHLWRSVTTIPVEWSSLTNLTFTGYNLQYTGLPALGMNAPEFPRFGGKEALALLKACPRLVHCNLVLQNYFDDNTPNPYHRRRPPPVIVADQITLRFLESLNLRGSVIPNGFASSLVLPSLRALTIVGHGAHPPQNEDDSGVVDFVRCFGDQLTTALFNYVEFTPSALLYTLEHLPNVTDLSLAGQIYDHSSFGHNLDEAPSAVFSSEVLGRLTPKVFGGSSSSSSSSSDDPMQPCLCPKLKRFACKLKDREFSEWDLIEFIAARRMEEDGGHGTVAQIREVTIKFNTYKETDVWDELGKRSVDVDDLVLKVVYPPEHVFRSPYAYSPFPPPFEGQYVDFSV